MNNAIDLIRSERIKKGVKQKDCARFLHLAATTYSEIEHKRSKLSADDFIALCGYLKIDLKCFQVNDDLKTFTFNENDLRTIYLALKLLNNEFKIK